MKNNRMKDKTEKMILESYESMYRMAYVYMKNEEDALDVVQDSVVKAIRSCGQLKEESYMKTWLFRIVINTAVDELERRKKVLPLYSENEDSKEDRYCDFDTVNSLERLNPTERTIILYRYCEEWKLEEIAEYLGINLSTVKSILYRSLKKLKTELMEGEAVS